MCCSQLLQVAVSEGANAFDMALFRFFIFGLIATANSQIPNVSSKPPNISITQLNRSITYTCDGGIQEYDILSRTWHVNGTEYSSLPDFESLWTARYEQLTVNTSALGFPYCSMQLTCKVLYNSDKHTEQSQPLKLKINESIAAPQVTLSHYDRETGCIQVDWEHHPQCTWADILSNVTSPNVSMPTKENNAGSYVTCSNKIKEKDVYIFTITPFNKFQVGKPATVTITIPEMPTTSAISPTSNPTSIPVTTTSNPTVGRSSSSSSTSTSSRATTQTSPMAETSSGQDHSHELMLNVLAPVFAALIILIAVALLLVIVVLILRRRPPRREHQPHNSFLDVNTTMNQIATNYKGQSTETIETSSKTDSNTSSTIHLVMHVQVVSTPEQPVQCQPVSMYLQDTDGLQQLAHNV